MSACGRRWYFLSWVKWYVFKQELSWDYACSLVFFNAIIFYKKKEKKKKEENNTNRITKTHNFNYQIVNLYKLTTFTPSLIKFVRLFLVDVILRLSGFTSPKRSLELWVGRRWWKNIRVKTAESTCYRDYACMGDQGQPGPCTHDVVSYNS